MKPALIVLIGAVGAAALIASTFAGSSQPSAAGRGQELVEGPVAGPVAEPDGRSAEGASPEPCVARPPLAPAPSEWPKGRERSHVVVILTRRRGRKGSACM